MGNRESSAVPIAELAFKNLKSLMNLRRPETGRKPGPDRRSKTRQPCPKNNHRRGRAYQEQCPRKVRSGFPSGIATNKKTNAREKCEAVFRTALRQTKTNAGGRIPIRPEKS
jgi:hypothetical protein